MEPVFICLAAFAAASLTFFSGFGLGTLLMPVVALFFPLDIAIAITAVVHFANNLFKLVLVGRNADRSVLLSFGLPAILFAFLGAILLNWLSAIPPLVSYTLNGHDFAVTPIKLTIGLLILVFLVLELSPLLASLTISRRFMPLGGMVSGFFGGLSGHQGAFRSMFLIRAGLTKSQFIATGVTLAVMVDLTRLLVYGSTFFGQDLADQWPTILSACAAAFSGSFLGNQLLSKMTYQTLQLLVSALLIAVALGLVSGII